MGKPVLAVSHLSVTIDGIDIVDDVSFTLDAGKTLALVGESGCGKSTLVKIIADFAMSTIAYFFIGFSIAYGKAYSHLDDVEKRMDSVADLAFAARWLQAQPEIDGERIVDIDPVLGYLHRGVEKICEHGDWHHAISNTDPLEYAASMFSESLPVLSGGDRPQTWK